jgi:hypothetical protein
LISGAVRALLEDLRERDVRLEADGLSMHVDAPKGVLTEEDKQDLAENKQQLLKLLRWETADMTIGWTGTLTGRSRAGAALPSLQGSCSTRERRLLE